MKIFLNYFKNKPLNNDKKIIFTLLRFLRQRPLKPAH